MGLAESELQPKRSESMTSMASVRSTPTAQPHTPPPKRRRGLISICHLMGGVNPSFICYKVEWSGVGVGG